MKSLKHVANIISPYNRGEKTLLNVLSNLKQEKKTTPIPVLFNAIKRLAPGLKVLPQIRAGRTIFLSAYLTEKSSIYYAIRWCLHKEGINLKVPFAQRLTSDLLDALQKTGRAYAFKKELNQSVINSRVNSKPVYRGKIKKMKKRKGRRKSRNKFRRFQKPVKKAKPSLSYLTDKISPITRSRVRLKSVKKRRRALKVNPKVYKFKGRIYKFNSKKYKLVTRRGKRYRVLRKKKPSVRKIVKMRKLRKSNVQIIHKEKEKQKKYKVL